MRARRIAALWLPGLPLQAVARDDPATRERPVAVTDGALVLARNLLAAEASVAVGMRVGEALTHAADLMLVPFDGRRTQALWDVVLDQMDALGPTVEDAGLGHALVDLTGVGRSERLLVRRTLQSLTALLGVTGRAAVADGPFVASVAARRTRDDLVLIPRDQGVAYLAPLPVTVLPLSAPALTDLALLGIRTIGHFVTLRLSDVQQRYDGLGMAAFRLAIGQDDRPLVPRSCERRETLSHRFDIPVDDLGPVLFVTKALLDTFAAILRREGLVSHGLRLALAIEGHASVAIEQRWSAPCVPGTAELDALRLVLAERIAGEERDGAMPPRVTELAATLMDCTPDSGTQLPLIGAAVIQRRQSIAHLLTRLHAVLGPMGVVEDTLVASHLIEERWCSRPYDPARIGAAPATMVASDAPSFPSLPGFVLRRPPDPVRLVCVGERVTEMDLGDARQPVIEALGPYTFEGRWWEPGPYSRSYWVIVTVDQTFHFVVEDRTTGRWTRMGVAN